jgi:diguanylate cyclase (GGDEF)-like protein
MAQSSLELLRQLNPKVRVGNTVKQSVNLAMVSNTAFEAGKAENLSQYDISNALQTTLEFNELISIFCSKIESMVPHSGYVYSNREFSLEIKNGVFTKHAYSHAFKNEQQPLGELKLMRNHQFTEAEIESLETLLHFLIYPLRNAALFHRALRMAYMDPLTQTHNRASFNDTINREIRLAIRQAKNLAIIFLDIDHFKTINDNYGHDCGDIMLASVAAWIKDSLRSSDLIFRYGGEEFVILLSDTDLADAELLAEKIRAAIERHTVTYDMNTIRMTASLGVNALRADDTFESFIKRADAAMYQAKKNGRNRVIAAR